MMNLPDGARIEKGPGGLEKLQLSSPHGEASVFLHGGHVCDFTPAGARPVLWMSQKSWFEPGRPIRGGIPVCFPWFGARAGHPDAPAHGIARLEKWTLDSVRSEADGGLVAVLRLDQRSGSPLAPGFAFDLRLTVKVDSALDVELAATNRAPEPATFEEALHTYFAVSDVRCIRVLGLQGLPFLDRLKNLDEQPPSTEPVTVTAETDRVYLGTEAAVTIADPGWQRQTIIEKRGSRTSVVWNPWVAKAAAMPDFGDDEWTFMMCIEAANARQDAITLAPGEEHKVATRICVTPL